MTRRAPIRELTEAEVIARLRSAVENEMQGRVVHSETEFDLRAFFSTLRTDQV